MTEKQITKKQQRRIVSESALMVELLAQGVPADFGIVSDDAGQFNMFDHALY